jgi:hypothetical protein
MHYWCVTLESHFSFSSGFSEFYNQINIVRELIILSKH